MMEKEISETYSFRPVDFDEKGRRILETLSMNTNEISTVAILQNMP